MSTTDDQPKNVRNGDAPVTPIDCEAALKRMYDYIDRELTDKDREEMAQHLHTCQSCFSRVEFEKLLKEKVRDTQVDEAGAHLSSRIKNLIKDF